MNRPHARIGLAVGVALLLNGCVSNRGSGQTTNAEKGAVTNTQLAIGYFARGRPELALEKIERALKDDPRSAEAHTVAGYIYESIGKTPAAEKHYETALKLAPDNGDILNNYGQFLCKTNRVTESLRYYERAVRQPFYKTPEVALTNAGACVEGRGEWDEAERWFRRALEIDSDYSEALFRLSRVLYEQGENFLARAFYQRFESVAGDTPESLLLCFQIENKMGDTRSALACKELLLKDYPGSPQANQF